MKTRRKPSSPLGFRLSEPIQRKREYLATANHITMSEAIRRLIEFAQPEDLDLELRSQGLRLRTSEEGSRHGPRADAHGDGLRLVHE